MGKTISDFRRLDKKIFDFKPLDKKIFTREENHRIWPNSVVAVWLLLIGGERGGEAIGQDDFGFQAVRQEDF